MNVLSTDTFCATYSREQVEPLAGTATRVDVWLLLEYRKPFSRKAFDEADLPAPVREHLDRALADIPNSRLQLIQRQAVGDPDNKIVFAVAVSSEVDPRLTVFPIAAVEEIEQIDIGAVVQGDSRYATWRSKEPLVLVCGNEKRDQCCGLRALAAAQSLQKKLGSRVWLTSHVGGHRYAATGVVLPFGIMFGRLDDADSNEFTQDIEAGRIHLPTLRGRSMYDPPTQAAEFYLRQQTGLRDFDAFRLVSVEAAETDRWTATFKETAEGAIHRVQVERRTSEFSVIGSCGEKQAEPTDLYELAGYQRSEASRA